MNYTKKIIIVYILLLIVILLLISICLIDYYYDNNSNSDIIEKIEKEKPENEIKKNDIEYIKFDSIYAALNINDKTLLFEQAKLGDVKNSGLTVSIINNLNFPSPMIDTDEYPNVVNMGLIDKNDNIMVLFLMGNNKDYKIYVENLVKSNLLKSDDEVSEYLLNSIQKIETDLKIDSIGKIYIDNTEYIGFKSDNDVYKVNFDLTYEKVEK